MTSLFQARRRAEELAAAVDGSPGHVQPSAEVATLLEVVSALREHPAALPRPEFTADLRTRLMVEAETSLDPVSAHLRLPVRERGKRRDRRLVAAASAFVLIGGSTTMAAAAQNALPGEALYPIKRGIERAEAGLSLDDAGKGRDLLSQASSRLAEVRSLVTDGSRSGAHQVGPTLAAFTPSAKEGSTLLFDSFRDTSDPQDIISVRTFAADGVETLQELAEDVPAEAQSDLAAAAILLQDIDREAAALCSTCSPDLPLVQVPGIFLARAEVDRALTLATSQELFNSHPVTVSKDAVNRVRAITREAEGADLADAGADSGTGTVSPPATDSLPAPAWKPESWPSLLPGIDTGSSRSKKSGGGDQVVEEGQDLTDGLGDAVETLLPEVGDGGLLD